jgi:hypothetical protein
MPTSGPISRPSYVGRKDSKSHSAGVPETAYRDGANSVACPLVPGTPDDEVLAWMPENLLALTPE